MLSFSEVAARAGMSVRTLDRRMKAGTGPKAIRVGRALVFTTTDVAAFVAAEEARRAA